MGDGARDTSCGPSEWARLTSSHADVYPVVDGGVGGGVGVSGNDVPFSPTRTQMQK